MDVTGAGQGNRTDLDDKVRCMPQRDGWTPDMSLMEQSGYFSPRRWETVSPLPAPGAGTKARTSVHSVNDLCPGSTPPSRPKSTPQPQAEYRATGGHSALPALCRKRRLSGHGTAGRWNAAGEQPGRRGFGCHGHGIPVSTPSVVLLIFGVVIGAIGGLMLRQQLLLRRRGVRVMGTVTRIEERLGQHVNGSWTGGSSYWPVVRFRTLAGEEIETITNVGTPSPRPPVGQQVPVVYDSADPTLAQIDTAGRRGVMTVLGWLMLPGGVVLVVVGVILLIQS